MHIARFGGYAEEAEVHWEVDALCFSF